MWAVKLDRPIDETKWTKDREEADKAQTGLRPLKAKREALDLKGWVRSFPVKDLVDPWEHPGAASGLAMLTLWETQFGKFPTSAVGESAVKAFTRALVDAFKKAGEPFSVMPPVAVTRPIAANCPTCHHTRFPVIISHPPPGFETAWKERLKEAVKAQWKKPRYTPRQKQQPKQSKAKREEDDVREEDEARQSSSEEEAVESEDLAVAPSPPLRGTTTPQKGKRKRAQKSEEEDSESGEDSSSESVSSTGSWVFPSPKGRKRHKTSMATAKRKPEKSPSERRRIKAARQESEIKDEGIPSPVVSMTTREAPGRGTDGSTAGHGRATTGSAVPHCGETGQRDV